MKLFKYLVAIGLLLICGGCVSMEQLTLPATQEKEYRFASYILHPPWNPDWRLNAVDKSIQAVSFIHAKHYTSIYFNIQPIFEDVSEKKNEEEIIAYFQDKMLKDYKLSPDIVLTEQSIQRKNVMILPKEAHSGEGRENNNHRCEFKVLTIDYTIEKNDYQLIVYYWINEPRDIAYTFYIFKNMKHFKDPAWHDQLIKDFEQIVSDIEFKEPESQKMMSMRVDYAVDNFNELVDKRYLKEKVEEIKSRYNLVIQETKRWIELKPDNYRGYFILGEMALFNDRFEKFGEGFHKKEALDYFHKSLAIRQYYKPVYVNMAEMYKAAGDSKEALANYEMAIKISPNDDDLCYKVGQILEGQNKRGEAIAYYRKAIRHWGSGVTTRDQLKTKIKEWEKSGVKEDKESPANKN